MANKEKKTPGKTDSEMVRRFKQNPLVFVGSFFILVLVIVAFVMPSSLGLSGAGRNDDLTFGYYDKVPISYVPGNYFAQSYEMEVRKQQNTMYDMNPELAWSAAFQAATLHTAVLQEMKRAGYTAPEKTVDREVARLPQFQENGHFSRTLYRQMDENQRLTLWRQIQESIIKSNYFSDIIGLLMPEAETEFIGKMGFIERNFEMAVFPVDAYPETEYEAYARENPDLFRSARLSVLTVMTSEREAQRILASIKDGETTFEDAARAYSSDRYADRGGDMGLNTFHELRFDIPDESDREKIMSLTRGEYSDIINANAGWAFFRAEDDAQEADIDDPAVMDKVRSYVRGYMWGRMEDWATAQADSFIELVNETGFEEAATRQDLQTRSFGPVAINYGNIDLFSTLPSPPSPDAVPELTGAAVNENFWKTAFATPINAPSRPVVQGRNVLVLFPNAQTEAEESTLESIGAIYSGAMNYIAEQILKNHFLNSTKMENKFADTFRYLSGQ